jgi:translocation and assembly module TamA
MATCVLAANDALSYRVTIEGIADSDLRNTLKTVSNTVARSEQPPSSLRLLRQRADRDVPRLLKALKAHSFYGAKVEVAIETERDPIEVIFEIDPGNPFLLKSLNIEVVDEAPPKGLVLPDPNSLGLPLEAPARSKLIVDAEGLLSRWFRRRGFPFPSIVQREVLVDHATEHVAVTFRVRLGPEGRFGATEITGLTSVRDGLVRGKIPWEKGDAFNGDLLDEVRTRLLSTDLFVSVEVKPGDNIDERGRVPVGIKVKERKHRTVKGGVRYTTDEGLGGKISWEHRNFRGLGERLRTAIEASEITLAGEGEFRKPDFLRDDQKFSFNVRVARDDTDAYTSVNLTSAAVIERQLRKTLRVSVGPVLTFSDVEQLDTEESYALLSLAATSRWDKSDRLLDPTEGWRLSVEGAPYTDLLNQDLVFIKGYASTSRYLKVFTTPHAVLAGRVACGILGGAKRDDIPADVRFYAGGGGSIRGYAYQSVGPLEGDTPLGGRSLCELSTELRVKVSRNIGLVGFIDGGSAFENEVPDFEEQIRWGAGVGLRYHTPVGPIRLDVGVPLNRRKDIDDSFQVYISLGQAF